MPSEQKTTVKAAVTADPSHGAELTAEQAAKSLGSLGDESAAEVATPAETPAETTDAELVTTEDQPADAEGKPEADEPDSDEVPASIPKERLDREIEKKRKATERADSLEAELNQTRAKLDDQATAIAERMALHPDFVSVEDRKTILRANELEAEKARLIENWDGIENDDPKQAKSAVEVRRDYARVDAELSRLSGAADAAYRKGKADQAEALRIGMEIQRQRRAAAKPPAGKPAGKALGAPAPVRASAPAARPIGTAGRGRPEPLNIFREKMKLGDEEAAATAALRAL